MMVSQGISERTMIAVIVLSALLLLTPKPGQALNVGDKAPDFTAFSTVEETVRLSDYLGKKNVMMFFFVRAFGGV
jgi:hypothetical protein